MQNFQGTDTVHTLIAKISFYILNPFISILFGAAFLFFLWGVVEYLWKSDSDEARSKGTKHIAFGLIGMLIMFAAFVILHVIAGTIGSDATIPN